MHNPPHPGGMIRIATEASDQTIRSAAEHLGISRKHLSAVINGRAPISTDLAIRLAQAYGGGGPGTWIRLQAAYDAWQADHSPTDIHVDPVSRVA